MTRKTPMLVALALAVAASGCWEQFQGTDPPVVDDDDSFVEDDDDTTPVQDDDDSSAVDDDDVTEPPPECSPAATLSCGDQVAGNNSAPGSTTVVDTYGCSAITLDGPEFTYDWVATDSGDVAVTITGLEADLDLTVLAAGAGGACDPASCVGSSNGTDTTEEVLFAAVAGNRYHFVVDGFSGAVSNYEIAVDCDPGAGDDDDSSVGDDDDSSVGDDDDATPVPCSEAPSVVATVALTDPSGAPTTELAMGSPMTATLSLENIGGGTESQVYGSPCLFAWSLWYADGSPVNGGPTCAGGVTFVDLVCGEPPTTDAHSFEPVEGLSGIPVPAGSYELRIETYNYGIQVFTVTVP